MKKILSVYILLMCVIFGVNAQADLPYESFSATDFAADSLFSNKNNVAWENTDGGRVSMPKGSSFTFNWTGKPGVLSFSAKSNTYIFSANGKYRIEVSSDAGATWLNIANSVDLSSSYAAKSHTLPIDVQMVRITNVATASNGTTFYLQALKVSHYDLTADLSRVDFPETKGLNTSLQSIYVQGKSLTGNLSLRLTQNNPNFILSKTSIDKEESETEGGALIDISFSPIELGNHMDTLEISDGVKDTIRIPLQGLTLSFQAYLNIESSLEKFKTEYLKESEAQKVYINALHLISDVSVKAPNHFEVSLDSIHFFKTMDLKYDMLNEVVDTVLFIRLNTPFVGTFSGTLSLENAQAKIPLQEIKVEGLVTKSIPSLAVAPTVDRNLIWGESLDKLQFEGGSVVNSKGEVIKGSFRWVVDPAITPEIGLHVLPIYFVPEYSYGYETIDCETNVRVLKREQAVLWEQEFEEIHVGDQIELTATATSGLPVVYEINNPEIIKVEGNTLTALSEGRVRVIGTQLGNDYFEAAGGVAYYITVLSPLSVTEQTLPKTTVYWNDRANGILTVNSELSMMISVMDAQGRTVISNLKADTTASIALNPAKSGLYFIRIVYRNGSQEVIKVIK